MIREHIAYVDIDLEDLIPDFLKHRREDVSVVTQHLASGNFDEIRRIGHSMKGSGAGYGFDEISEIGKRIEVAAMEQDTQVIERELQSLSDYVAKVKIVWQEE